MKQPILFPLTKVPQEVAYQIFTLPLLLQHYMIPGEGKVVLHLTVLNVSLFHSGGAQCDANVLVGYGRSAVERGFKHLPLSPHSKTSSETFRVSIFVLYLYIQAS